MNIKNIDIIVLNYNGEDILRECLPSIVKAAKNSPAPCNVIVLDNRSTDNSVNLLKKDFPNVHIETAKENRVLFSYNALVPELNSDVVILLNNDVKVDADFIAPLLKHFNDQKVFAVAPKQYDFNGQYNGGMNRISFRSGLINAGPFSIDDAKELVDKEGFTHYEANSAYDREKFIELGGFDDIYYPFLWEDTDLGYRAWKAGYKFIYEPKSVIHHQESYTFDRESGKIRGRRILTRRNSFVFTWKNITDPVLLAQHLVFLPFNLVAGIFRDWARIAAFLEAVLLLPKIARSRMAAKKRAKISDAKILKML